MTEITYPHFDQHYSKYVFRNAMSNNLQLVEENGDTIKFYWINFIASLLFLCKQFYNPKLKVIIIISCLIHLAISHNALSVLFNCWNYRESQKFSHKRIFHNLGITYNLQN